MKNIVFSAGSMSGIAFVGAWRALENAGMTSHLTGFSGCSIGAVMALLTSLGYTADELTLLATSLKYEELADIQLLNIMENLGFDTGNKITHLITELVARKTGKRSLSFKEHFLMTGRVLHVVASCVQTDECIYYSKDTFPDMDVITATRMSIALPWIIAAVKYNGLTYIDGGFHDPCPVKMFSKHDTIVLRIKNTSPPRESGFIQHTKDILFSAYRRLYNEDINEYPTVTIVSILGSMTLDVNKRDRKILIRIGYETMQSWIQSNNKEIKYQS